MHTDTGGNADHFDLLPFIAILMCVLGCLLLVTMSMAAISVGVDVGKRGEGWTVAGPVEEGRRKTPVLIEWDGGAAVIHCDDKKVAVKWSQPSGVLVSRSVFGIDQATNGEDELIWVSLGEVPESDKEFHEQLKYLEGLRETHYALFAVRPSGFKTFNRFADEFRRLKIDVGYEPIRQERPVRLLIKETKHAQAPNAVSVR
ncbi:MAG: hypothetical protein JW959_09585 [Pirellulales bacterium]|nr:hypothetical protein [Pirellulales bacterium]